MADVNSSIIRNWNNRTIRQREDGYLSLTDMAQACNKIFGNWKQLKSTESYLTKLSSVIAIPITELVQVNQGGVPEEQGTWGHNKVAIRFAQWCSDEFAIQVDCWIEELFSTGKIELADKAASVFDIKAEIDVISHCLAIAGIPNAVIAGVALNHAEEKMPQLRSAATKESRSLLAASSPSELLLNPGTIGDKLGVSAIKVNKILLSLGYQVKNVKKKSKTEPDYLVTEIGKPYAGNTLGTGDRGDNTTYQHLKWKSSVVEIIRNRLIEQPAIAFK